MAPRLSTVLKQLLFIAGFTGAIFAGANSADKISFSLHSLEGQKVTLDSLRGKIVVIDVWAVWCITCREVFPILNEMRRKYSQDNVEIIGISIDQKPAAYVKDFAERVGITYKLVRDPEMSFPNTYKLKGVPTLFVLDPELKVVFQKTGFQKGEKEELAKLLENLHKSWFNPN